MPRRFKTLWCVFVLLASAAATAAPTDTQSEPAKDKPIPAFSEVKRAVLKHFRAIDDYRPGDLITRDEVETLVPKLRKIGLPLADAKKILTAVLDRDSLLARQLVTDDGRRFMRKISGYSDAYDRLDRLNRLPHGPQTVDALIKGPGGYEMIEYMTKTAGGKELGKQLANSPRGTNFNATTGRIYTVNLLLDRLAKSRAAALKAANSAT